MTILFIKKTCIYLHLIFKVIEKVIRNSINLYSINYTCQSGFRKKDSMDFCLSYLSDKNLKDFNKGMMTGTYLIDLKKTLTQLFYFCS